MQQLKSSYLYMVNEGGEIGKQFGELYSTIEATTVLDKKTFQLVYVAYLASRGSISGIQKHVGEAKSHGATKEEVRAVLQAGLPIAGSTLADAYKAAMECFEE